MTTTATDITTLRQPTLDTLGLGTVLDIFRNGKLPVDAEAAVTAVFGPPEDRGSMVISGASGIVGAGKTMQFASRLAPFGVRIVALDFPGAPDGIGAKYDGLVGSFGKAQADRIMSSIVRLTYDGKTLPAELDALKPRFLLEAIPEILEVKRAHYTMFRERFPELEIRSVTSGFPARELGVGVAHPAFPHEINKIFEVVEDEPSDVTRMLWALGLIPVPVSDDWSFILDVLFCGITLAALRYARATNMPYWKVDKYVRKLVGPNPFRAHDAIGSKGADFLTWSCLHHLSEEYGALFEPTPDLVERKETGEAWYPPNHFRPLVDWQLSGEEQEEMRAWILGPVFQMTSLMLRENRGHLAHMNAIGELCAQFTSGVVAAMRREGPDGVKALVETSQALVGAHPAFRNRRGAGDPVGTGERARAGERAGAALDVAGSAWHPDALSSMDTPAWQQLYVNAEHDGTVGVLTISRESYNWDVDAEMNRAMDWLLAAGIERVIVTGDFHLSTQMVGADTAEFFPAMEDLDSGLAITRAWTTTSRRLWEDFQVSVAFVSGKRCLGGMLEMAMHAHYLVADQGTRFGWPEVTLPVVPGMEACHWPLRRADAEGRKQIVEMLMTGRPRKAEECVGWLVDYAGPVEEALHTAWVLARGDGAAPADDGTTSNPVGDAGSSSPSIARRPLTEVPMPEVDGEMARVLEAIPAPESPQTEGGREAIADCIRASLAVDAGQALEVQARLAAEFLAGPVCAKGVVGGAYQKTVKV
jgi:enoyl-CoA hydratase/carnithine racemase/3-hydroxyacyl-CoA dehydrogenase